MTEKQNKWVNWAFNIMSIFILPVIGYSFHLHSTIAVQETQLKNQNQKIERLEEDVKKVRDNEVDLVRLEQKMEAANEKLDDIKKALESLP